MSATSDPLGPYYRYEFQRRLFPDYPRPAVWPDGYYNPTSTSDDLLPDIYSIRVTLATFLPAIKDRVEVKPGMRSLLEINLSRVFSSIHLLSTSPAPTVTVSKKSPSSALLNVTFPPAEARAMSPVSEPKPRSASA